jgi:hypothetical protein
VRLVIAENLYAFADGRTDDCAFQRLMVIDGRARHRADDGAAGLAVVMTMVAMVMMMCCGKGTSGRQKERNAQQCRLDFLHSHVCTSGDDYCEIGAGKLNRMNEFGQSPDARLWKDRMGFSASCAS